MLLFCAKTIVKESRKFWCIHLYIYGWTVKVHFSGECIKLMISAFESLAFHSLSAWDWRFPQPIEMLTLRTMVGGLQMTNNELEQYIDEVLGENDEMKEEIEELKTDNQKLKEQNQNSDHVSIGDQTLLGKLYWQITNYWLKCKK